MQQTRAGIHAASLLQQAVSAVNFDSQLAMKLAVQMFPGVEEPAVKRKANEVLVALVQRQLKITAEMIAVFRSDRAEVEQKFAPRPLLEAPLNEANAHICAMKETLHCERTSFYTAVLIGSGVEEAGCSFEAAQIAVADAEEKARLAEQQLNAAKALRKEEEAELGKQLYMFDDRNALVLTFLEWQDAQLPPIIDHDPTLEEMREYERSGSFDYR